MTLAVRCSPSIVAAAMLLLAFSPLVLAQQPDPVVRKVENPVTDTPYVNPLQQDQPVRVPVSRGVPPIQAGDELHVSCFRESYMNPPEGRVSICEGAVDARIGTYRLQADKVTVYDARN